MVFGLESVIDMIGFERGFGDSADFSFRDLGDRLGSFDVRAFLWSLESIPEDSAESNDDSVRIRRDDPSVDFVFGDSLDNSCGLRVMAGERR